MKKILLSIFAICAVSLSATAQRTQTNIVISDVRTHINGRMLDLGFRLSATGLDIQCNGHIKLEFAIENAEQRLVLPAVIYSGTLRYRYEQRRQALSGSYVMEPYKVYEGVKKNQRYDFYYAISIPYKTWMEHASVNYIEYAHDCSGDYILSGNVLVSDINPAPTYIEPEIWSPDAALFPNLVSFLVPDVEEIKSRAAMLELNINFPVNSTEVRQNYMNNPRELGRADSLVRALSQNRHIDIRGISIHGYASPEGSYRNNERLAKGRSEGFKNYLINQYPHNEYIRNARTLWTPEDWEGLARLVQASDMLPHKNEVLAVVLDGSMAPDTKDQVLQKIGQRSYVYKPMLDEMYPKLRRIELRVDHTIHNFTDAEAREFLYTRPDMLSLEEIYRVARYYTPGSEDYRTVYEIAARQYPDDVIANNNAAAAFLREGNTEAALPYLRKTEGSDSSLINYGAYYYIMGDLDKAMEYFNKAQEAGAWQAGHNLRLINPAAY